MSDTRQAWRLRAARMRWRLVPLALAALTGLSCATAPTPSTQSGTAAAYSSAVFPAAEWDRVDDPASVGWSRAGLDSVRAILDTLPEAGYDEIADA